MSVYGCFAIIFAATAMIVSIANPGFAAETSNVIVILADDFRFGSTNAKGAPESIVKTPNQDRPAKEGQ